MKKSRFGGLFAITRNLALLVSVAVAFAYGPAFIEYLRADSTPWPMRALQAFVLLWTAILPVAHEGIRERAKACPACPAHEVERGRLRYACAQLLLNNVGIIVFALIVFVMIGDGPGAYALAAVCVATMILSGAKTVYCLFGRDGDLKERPEVQPSEA